MIAALVLVALAAVSQAQPPFLFAFHGSGADQYAALANCTSTCFRNAVECFPCCQEEGCQYICADTFAHCNCGCKDLLPTDLASQCKSVVPQQVARGGEGATVMERYECYLNVLDEKDKCIASCDSDDQADDDQADDCTMRCFAQMLDGTCHC